LRRNPGRILGRYDLDYLIRYLLLELLPRFGKDRLLLKITKRDDP
jgi:hypothetical protein